MTDHGEDAPVTPTTRQTPWGARLARAGTAVLALGLAAGLAACSPEEAGSAAVVGDRTVSTEDLEAALEGIRSGNEQFAQVPASAVLVDLIAEPYLLEAAREAGRPVSPDSAEALLTATSDPDERAVRVLQAQIALESLDEGALREVSEQLQRVGVELNPRYGTFDASTLQISSDARPDWLAESPDAGAAVPPGQEPGQPGQEQPGQQQPGQVPGQEQPGQQPQPQPQPGEVPGATETAPAS